MTPCNELIEIKELEKWK